MYGHNTDSANKLADKDLRFYGFLTDAAGTIYDRLQQYDPERDPLKRSHLKLLWDIVTIEAERVALGESSLYSGLESPINAVRDWGEPANSPLCTCLMNAEQFFRKHYRNENWAAQAVH